MPRQAPAGPSGGALWQERSVGVGTLRPPTLLLLPASGDRPAIVYYLPKAPQLARDAARAPLFSLTILLSRRPHADEEHISALIQQSTLSFAATLAVPSATLESLQKDASDLAPAPTPDYRPLYVRAMTLSLVRVSSGSAQIIATAQASGPGAWASISTTLDRDSTLDALSALDGNGADLEIRAEISYRVVLSGRPVRLFGSWGKIHDALSRQAGAPDTSLGLRDVRRGFEDMLTTGVLRATVIGTSQDSTDGDGHRPVDDVPVDGDDLFRIFMQLSPVVLQRVTTELDGADQDNSYVLRARPDDAFTLDVQTTASGSDFRRTSIATPLAVVLGGALDGLDRDSFIHLVAPDGGEAGGMVRPRRIRTSRRGPGDTPSSRMQVALVRGALTSVAAALRPELYATTPARLLLHSDVATQMTVATGPVRHWWLDDGMLIDPHRPQIEHLPVVADPAESLWPDRVTPEVYWYPPSFELVRPSPATGPAGSPFLFSFQRSGATASGKPGLDGTITMTLHARMSAQTEAALVAAGNPRALPVPIDNLSVWLAVPFRDETGATRSQTFPAHVAQADDVITATIQVIDDWVRLCYGALSVAGFQSQPAHVYAAYSYAAYVPARAEDLELALGGKAAITPVLYAQADVRQMRDRPYFDATDISLKLPTAETRLQREPPLAGHDGGGAAPAWCRAAASPAGSAPVTAMAPAVAARAISVSIGTTPRPAARAPINAAAFTAVALARPQLASTIDLSSVILRRRNFRQTLLRQEQMDALFPCDTLGALYQEVTAGGMQAVGCRDALQIGQMTYRQYAELPERANAPWYSVYRSLQQPGRFLVLPTNYRLSRYAAADPDRAYRPAILIYSTIDVETPANNRVLFKATLQPDLPPHVRRDLLWKLSADAAEPPIEYPTAIESEIAFAWTVGESLHVTPSAIVMPDGFQVTLSTDLTSALLVRDLLRTTGVAGSVTFTLPDSTTLRSLLTLDLTNITGPWAEGPIAVTAQAGAAHLANRIEHAVAVHDLVAYTEQGPGDPVPVEVVLAPGEAHDVPLPAGSGADIYAIYQVQSGVAAPEEITSFVEDIQLNIIFVNLINNPNHGLARLDVQARIAGIDHVYAVPMSGDPAVGHIEVTLPLTTYLGNLVLQFQVTKTFETGDTATTAWIDWNLRDLGNVISLVWPLIA